MLHSPSSSRCSSLLPSSSVGAPRLLPLIGGTASVGGRGSMTLRALPTPPALGQRSSLLPESARGREWARSPSHSSASRSWGTTAGRTSKRPSRRLCSRFSCTTPPLRRGRMLCRGIIARGHRGRSKCGLRGWYVVLAWGGDVTHGSRARHERKKHLSSNDSSRFPRFPRTLSPNEQTFDLFIRLYTKLKCNIYPLTNEIELILN